MATDRLTRPTASRRLVLAAVVGATIAAAALRVPGIDREITHDEAYSWVRYASVSYEQVFGTYHLPNNHILHTALMRLSAGVFGTQDEWVLRLPALVAGVASVPVAAALATTALASPLAGVVAAWCLALHPSHIAYSQSARGYSMVVLFVSLSWWASLHGLGGRRFFWIAFALAAFLASWTLPSAALFVPAMGGISVALLWRRHGAAAAWPAVAATGVGAVAGLLAYWPVLGDLLQATQVWGIPTWTEPEQARAALITGLQLLAPGVALLVLAAAGWALLAWQRHTFALQAVAVVAVPLAAAALTGVAGQGRSYFYLLPAVIVLASAWVTDRGLVRLAGALLCGLVWIQGAWAGLHGPAADHGYAALGKAYAERGGLNGLMAPVYLDVPLDMYTRQTEMATMQQVLHEGRLDGLLFACQDTDSRSTFERYNLATDHNRRFELSLRPDHFEELFRTQQMCLRGLSGGSRFYPRAETDWEGIHGDVGLRLAAAVFSDESALGLRSGGDFVVIEGGRFRPQVPGVVAVAFASRGDGDIVVTLCQQQDAGDWQPLPAYLGQIIALKAPAEDGRLWRLDLRAVFVESGPTYAACIVGQGAGERYVGDLLYTYFPLKTEPMTEANSSYHQNYQGESR